MRGSSFAFDFRLGFAYYAGAELPSGLYLPDVLQTTDGALINQSEYTAASAGLGLYYQIFTYMKMNLVVDGNYYTPHLLEHPYPVSTGMDTFGVSGAIEMQVMIRAQDD